MMREKQIALIESAEERTAGFLRKWLQVPAFKAAIHRQDTGKDGDGGHEECQPRRTACA
jgi:hypothetical protein